MDNDQIARALRDIAAEVPEKTNFPSFKMRIRRRLIRNGALSTIALSCVALLFPLAANLGRETKRVVGPQPTPSVAESVKDGFFPPEGEITFISPRLHRQRAAVFAMNSDGTDIRLLSESSPWYVEWAPDGKKLLSSNGISEGHGSLVVEDVNTGARTKIYVDREKGSLLNPQRASWSPDGQKIAFISTHGDIYLINPDGSGLRSRPVRDSLNCAVLGLDWSPDSARLAFTSKCRNEAGDAGQGGLGILDIRTGEMTPVGLGQHPQNPAWSPDGRYIAFDDASGRIMLVDMSKREFEFRPLTEGPHDSDPAWSPDSSAIIYVSEETGDHDIRMTSVDGTQELSLTSTAPADTAPEWRPGS